MTFDKYQTLFKLDDWYFYVNIIFYYNWVDIRNLITYLAFDLFRKRQ